MQRAFAFDGECRKFYTLLEIAAKDIIFLFETMN